MANTWWPMVAIPVHCLIAAIPRRGGAKEDTHTGSKALQVQTPWRLDSGHTYARTLSHTLSREHCLVTKLEENLKIGNVAGIAARL